MKAPISAEIFNTPPTVIDAAVEAHQQLLMDKLEEVLEQHKVKLGVDGVELIILTPPNNPNSPDISIVYEIRKDGVLLDTFGWEIDLTRPS